MQNNEEMECLSEEKDTAEVITETEEKIEVTESGITLPTGTGFIKLRNLMDITEEPNTEVTAGASGLQNTQAKKVVLTNVTLTPSSSRRPSPTCIISLLYDRRKRVCRSCSTTGILQYSCLLSDDEFYLCHLECLRNHFRKMPISQARNTSFTVEVSPCSFCKSNQTCFESMLSWRTLHFCNETCLRAYRKFFLEAGCAQCKGQIIEFSEDVFVRYSRSIEAFCSTKCQEQCPVRCRFCQGKMGIGEVEFCSQDCKIKFSKIVIQRNFMGICHSCRKRAKIIFVVNIGGIDGYFCKTSCLEEWMKYYQSPINRCVNCNVFYDYKIIKTHQLIVEAKKHNFCSPGCQNIFVEKMRRWVLCVWCFKGNYNTLMIVKYVGNSIMYLCSMQCLRGFTDSSCSTCSQKTATYFHLQLNTFRALHFCMNKCLYNFLNYHLGGKQYEMDVDPGIDCKILLTRGSQTTDLVPDKVPIPVPLPVYLAVSKEAFKSPENIKRVPLPIPVPIYFPTLKDSSGNIMEDITRITGATPINPLEAEMVKLAELVAKEANVKQVETVTREPVREIRFGVENSNFMVIPQLSRHLFNPSIGVAAWNTWLAQISPKYPKTSKKLLNMTHVELNKHLSKFINEIKKPNGEAYNPDTILYFCLGIQQYLNVHHKVVNIFHDNLYKEFSDNLDKIIFKFVNDYITSRVVVTRIQENYLWETHIFGLSSPIVLLQTLIYFNTKYLNLHTVEQHFEVTFQNFFKNYQRTQKPKEMEEMLRYFPPNVKKYHIIRKQPNQMRCPIKLYDFYCAKCPEAAKSMDSFYLQPEIHVSADSPVWFANKRLDRQQFRKMLNLSHTVQEVIVSRLEFKNMKL